jgi:cob(I)alamin adenosyltransferase
MLIVNTGNGKGKTTAAIGQIIRFLGHGFKVCLIQLFKSEKFYGEQKILVNLKNFDFFAFAKKHPYFFKNVTFEDVVNNCYLAMNKIELLATNPKKYDLIVLDEFNIALHDKFIDEKRFLILIDRLLQKSDIIVTGRNAPQSLIDIADIVTEMKETKHCYNKCVQAQKGIEY